ncbi:hypothetical protein Tco_0397795 [Tanacetum coccineum]
MDRYTKNFLWDYWRRGDDDEVSTNEELSNPDDGDLIEKYKIVQIFGIDTDLFHYETPLCEAFKEFNYLSQIDVNVLIPGFKTYEEYKDDWIYEWNKGIPWVEEKPWLDDGPWAEPIDNVNHKCKPLHFKTRNKRNETIQDKKDLNEHDDDNIEYLEDYLIQKDPPYFVNVDEENIMERR